MRILETIGCVASVISLVVAIGFQWQGAPETQRNIALVCLVIFIGLTFFGFILNHCNRKPPRTSTRNELGSNKLRDEIDSVLDDIDSVLVEGNPYPIGFESAKLGTKLTVLLSLFPSSNNKLSADLLSSTFSVEIPKGMFERVVYYLGDTDGDPEVRQVTFRFRNEKTAELVRSAALKCFGTVGVKTKTLGSIMEWSDVKGSRVNISDGTYSILRPY